MKIFKYSLFIAALFSVSGLLSSCDDDPTGAGDATIGFAQSAYVYKESAGLVKIPVTFTGEPKSYPITFDVSAQIEGTEVTLDEVVLFTQLEGLRYVGNPKAPVYIEFQLIDNEEINDSRFMKLTITSASGATIENATTTIEIADNDNNPYEKLWGNWTFSGNSISSSDGGAVKTFNVNISGGFTAEEVEKNADKVLVCWGFGGNQDNTAGYEPPKQPVWYINYDADAQSLSISVNTLMANVYGFNGIDEDVEVKSASTLPGASGFDYKTQVKGTWSEDLNTLTFEKGYGFAATVWGVSGTYYGFWYGYENITMTRKAN
ncbi:hypothetical protein [uncultured Alistipes sp.]|uniref:hypothetical protein n=1 Tax=uncultured Alistipes sp. TaxID=538949 RepID=UPI0026196480|nr:hypothetical protein [uncultured Alistipes sp.]